MHETLRYHQSLVGQQSYSAPRSVPRWLQIEFWLPVGAVFFFCLIVSADRGYAISGGAEVYSPRMTANSVRQAAFLGLGAVGGILLTVARPARPAIRWAWTILLPTVATTSYMFMSIIWSDDATMTFKRTITAALVILAGLGIGRVWSSKDLAWGIVLISGAFLVVGILVELKYRAFLNGGDYRFSGVFHPAKQAFNCGFLLIAAISIYYAQRSRWILPVIGMAIVFLILTKARTGTAAAIVAGGWLAWNYGSARGWIMLLAAGAILACSALLFYQGITGRDLALSKVTTMGRNEETADPTKLTGRLPIWQHAFGQFTQQPILGYGYGAFWTMNRLEEFERRNGWALFHAHSTYLESLLNLGIIGVGLGLLCLLLVYHRSVTSFRQGDRFGLLVAALLLFALIGGFFEIAFIGLEYESIVMAACIGVMVFSANSTTACAEPSTNPVARRRR